jgi:PAS domain S-box-containing protein
MNRSLLDLLGKNEKEAVGNPYEKFSIFPPKSGADPLLALLQNMEAEPYLYAPTQKYYRGKAEILRSKEGRFNGYIITTTDVTSILLEQERLARERSLLDTIFNSSPDLMAYIDADMRYQAVNKRYAALYGLAAEDVPGRYVEELVPENYRDDLIRIYKLCREQKTPVYAESKYTFADGHEEHLDIVRSAIFNDKNELLGYLSVSRDVSLRVKIETTLRNTQVQLENTAREALKASEAKSNFLARMSHEIRTPMNAIIGMTEIIRRKLNNDGTHGDELPGHIQQIARSANHLLGLINDILDISKIEAGKINLVEEAFDMRALLDNVYSIILPRCEEKAIKLEVDIDDLGKKRVFEGDSLRIRQVLINLLGNAAKFTPECGWINFSVKLAEHGADRDKIFFSIKDSGIGIPESSLKNIFNPFEQAEGHLARRYGGTGLGLTISSNIVRMMGGTLEVQSEEGKGSDFYFSIWLKRREELLTDVDTAAVDMECLADKRLLLVDDVDINRMILTEILADTGLVIDEAEDGKEAVDMFEKSPTGYYDIIFMDVQMPHMNGYDATMAIRGLERPDAETVPIIALTANAFKEDVEMAIANGMNAHLAKPVEIERVMETLTVFLCSPKSPNAV